MSATRTLKLALLADVAKFGQGMTNATRGVNKFDKNVKSSSARMGKAFAAVGAAAGAMALSIGVSAVKAAAEDELSQKKLAKALQNTTKATTKQIASTEEYITKQQLQYGISDNKLRPALANLARATGSLTTAQKLNNLAIDISAATGKDLETVSLALSKAYNGNLGALKKLGVPLDQSIIKSKDFNAATDQLQKLFGGSAQANTETFAGKLAILKETFGELKEGLGAKLLPVLTRVMETVQKVARAFSGQDPDGLSARARELKGEMGDNGAGSLGRSLKNVADSFTALFDTVNGDGGKAGSALQTIANALNGIAGALKRIKENIAIYKSFGGKLLDTIIIGDGKAGFASGMPGIPGGARRALGGPVSGGGSYLVGERGPEMFTPNGNGRITPNNAMGGNTFIFNGVIDGESARRSIERLMQSSARRTSAVNFIGATL